MDKLSCSPNSRHLLTFDPGFIDKCILRQSALKTYTTAPERTIKMIKTWHKNHDHHAIAEAEQRYFSPAYQDELIAVVQNEKTPLRKLIDSSRLLRNLSVWKDNSKKTTRRKIQRNRQNNHALERVISPTCIEDDAAGEESLAWESGHFVSYYSDRRVDHFVSVLIVGVGVGMLIAPLWVLQALDSATVKLAVITVFVSFFLIMISFLMVAKPFEALGSTAA